MPIEIRFLSVGTADAVVIKITEGEKVINLLIDSGTKATYQALKRELKAIMSSGQTVFSWIITHWDSDHIGGIMEFLEDNEFKKTRLIESIWFNANYEVPVQLEQEWGNISAKQAESLRDFIERTNGLETFEVTTDLKPFQFSGGEIIFLSPTKVNLAKALKKLSPFKSIGSSEDSNDKTVEELAGKKFVPDRSPINRSCIALLLKYDSRQFMFLADASPLDIIPELRKLRASEDRPLDLELMQVAHHGSKKNTSEELLRLCRAKDYVISGDGRSSSKLPDKETLVRIISHPQRNFDEKINIYLTNRSKYNETMFHVDGGEVFQKLNFSVFYPPTDRSSINFNYT